VQLVEGLGPHIGGFHFKYPSLLCDALHKARADRQLCRAEAQRFTCDFFGHAVDFEHDATWLDAGRPVIDGTLAFTHTDFGWLRGNRKIREHTNPDASLTLHLTSDRTTGRFDLTSSDSIRLKGFKAEAAEVQVCSALGRAMDTSLELLAELCALWLQHRSSPKFLCFSGVFATALVSALLIAFHGATFGS